MFVTDKFTETVEDVEARNGVILGVAKKIREHSDNIELDERLECRGWRGRKETGRDKKRRVG